MTCQNRGRVHLSHQRPLCAGVVVLAARLGELWSQARASRRAGRVDSVLTRTVAKSFPIAMARSTRGFDAFDVLAQQVVDEV